MHRSMNGFWLSVALIVSVAAQSEPVDRDAIVRGIDLLTSPVLAEQTAGEAWRARYGREVILALLTRLEEDSLDRAPQTAHELTMLLSPGSAGLVARQRHFGHMRLGRFPRRTDRAANHDLAPRVRIVAQDMIARLLEQKLPSDRYSKSPSYPGHERIGSLLTLCTLLTEVGDDATVGWLMQRLVALDNRFIGEVLLGSVEGILGLPR
ncbi:MAG: hypothetical protein KDB53_17500, partial [Planctomycetes bacterium]|nr:hypothetical protein [Planctomycetota bacterium]